MWMLRSDCIYPTVNQLLILHCSVVIVSPEARTCRTCTGNRVILSGLKYDQTGLENKEFLRLSVSTHVAAGRPQILRLKKFLRASCRLSPNNLGPTRQRQGNLHSYYCVFSTTVSYLAAAPLEFCCCIYYFFLMFYRCLGLYFKAPRKKYLKQW